MGTANDAGQARLGYPYEFSADPIQGSEPGARIMQQTYDPAKIESEAQAYWAREQSFRVSEDPMIHELEERR